MKVFIVAGETSGDLHAARLMAALKQRVPDIEFYGIGGEQMKAMGLHSFVALEQMNVVGFWEVAKRYSFFKRTLEEASALMKHINADVFIPVDYPGFNMRLAAQAKAASIPVLWYIAPQLWAWGKNRAKKLAQSIDKLLVVFPFETEFFRRYSIDTVFVGHPLLDDPAFAHAIPSREGREHAVAFLPGSRVQEVERHIPIFQQVAEELRKQLPHLRCVVATSPSVPESIYTKVMGNSTVLERASDARALMRSCAAGVVKTGTSTLEAALSGLPFTMIYKTSPLSYWIGKRVVDLPYISLVNILARKTVVRELVQNDATVHTIVQEVLRLLNDDLYAQTMYEQFLLLREHIGESGASSRAADEVLAFLHAPAARNARASE